MENVSFGGRRVQAFAGTLAAPSTDSSGSVSPVYAALMTGATGGLLAYTLKAPVWGAVLTGAAVATATKLSIDRIA